MLGTVACQTPLSMGFSREEYWIGLTCPLSMGFSREEYWIGLTCPPPGDLPDPGTEPGSPALQADSFTAESPGKLH